MRIIFGFIFLYIVFMSITTLVSGDSNAPDYYQIKIWQGTKTSIQHLVQDWTTICDTNPSDDSGDGSSGYTCNYNVGNQDNPKYYDYEGNYYAQGRVRDEDSGTWKNAYGGDCGVNRDYENSGDDVNGCYLYTVNYDNSTDSTDCSFKYGSERYNPGGGNDQGINGTTCCCGDDPNEYYIGNSSQDPNNHPNDDPDPSNDACCNDTDDSVYNGLCHTSAKDGYSETCEQDENGNCLTNDYAKDASCYDNIDNDNDGKTDFCDSNILPSGTCTNMNGADDGCLSHLQFTITKEADYGSTEPAEGVNVTLKSQLKYRGNNYQLTYKNTTDSSGIVDFYVFGNLTYDITVESKEKLNVRTDKYGRVSSSVFAPFRNTVVKSYELLIKSNHCESDCTYTDDDICHAECDGFRGCKFFDEKTKSLCNKKAIGVAQLYSQDAYTQTWVNCCDGIPVKNVFKQWRIFINADNVYVLSKKILYRGHPAYLKLAIWDQSEVNNTS